jgi:Zn-finger nucleic acid-binding protein
MYRTHALPQNSCPRCFDLLVPRALGAESVLGCSKCGGVFLNNENSARVVQAFDADLASLDHELLVNRRVQIDPVDGRVDVEMQCPTCQRLMARSYVHAAACYVDACPEHGTWFDAEELSRVGRAFRASRKRGVMIATASTPAGEIMYTTDAEAEAAAYGPGGQALISASLAVLNGVLSLPRSR